TTSLLLEKSLRKIDGGRATEPIEGTAARNDAAGRVSSQSTSGLQAASLIKIAFIATVAAFSLLMAIRGLVPPSGVPATSPASEFSSERAMRHLKVIANKPHPAGSSEHKQVRDYILGAVNSMGLTPEVQSNTVISNIIVRLGGTGDVRRAVALVGHYDTVALSPGAADDGYGVATLLETVRALKAGAPLK